MENKYTRFFLIESQFKLRMIAIFLLVLILFFEGSVLKKQDGQIKEKGEQYRVVKKIPSMEVVLRPKKIQKKTVRVIPKAKDAQYVFQGTSVKDGVVYVMIDSEIYKEGEIIDNYIISKISDKMITLIDEETKGIKILRLYN